MTEGDFYLALGFFFLDFLAQFCIADAIYYFLILLGSATKNPIQGVMLCSSSAVWGEDSQVWGDLPSL